MALKTPLNPLNNSLISKDIFKSTSARLVTGKSRLFSVLLRNGSQFKDWEKWELEDGLISAWLKDPDAAAAAA